MLDRESVTSPCWFLLAYFFLWTLFCFDFFGCCWVFLYSGFDSGWKTVTQTLSQCRNSSVWKGATPCAVGEGDGMREGRGENEVPFLGLELL